MPFEQYWGNKNEPLFTINSDIKSWQQNIKIHTQDIARYDALIAKVSEALKKIEQLQLPDYLGKTPTPQALKSLYELTIKPEYKMLSHKTAPGDSPKDAMLAVPPPDKATMQVHFLIFAILANFSGTAVKAYVKKPGTPLEHRSIGISAAMFLMYTSIFFTLFNVLVTATPFLPPRKPKLPLPVEIWKKPNRFRQIMKIRTSFTCCAFLQQV